MNFRNLFVGAFAVAALSACSGGNDPASELGRVSAAEAPALGDLTESGNLGAYNIGVPNFIFSVASGSLMVDGVVRDTIDNATFEGFPRLAQHVGELSSTTRAVETKEQALELWSGESLILALDLRTEMPTILYSRSGLQADRISYVRHESEQGQGLAAAALVFDLRECRLGEAGHQGQGQFQGQEQVQEKVTEVCMNVTYALNLQEVMQPKEQEQVQEKFAPKEQVQEKVAPKEQVQEKVAPKEQIQEKVAPKEQIQEKVAPKEQIQEKVAPKEQIQEKEQVQEAPKEQVQEKPTPEQFQGQDEILR
jgi:hypothetical protein